MICAPVSVIHSQTCMRSGVTLIRLPWQKKMARISGSDARIAQYDDYRLWRLAASIPAEQRTDYVSAFLRNLMAYDIDNQSDYVKTLFIYLKNGQSLALTAQELHVHRNTVVYRIEKNA